MSQAITSTPLFTNQTGVPGQSAAVSYPTPKGIYGKYRVVPVPYYIGSTTLPAAGDIIQLARLKLGARVIAGLSRVICEDPGTTLTGCVGDFSNPKRYSGALVLSAASSGVGGGAIEFGSVAAAASYEQFQPMDIKSDGVRTLRVTPPAWVTGTTYNVGDQILTNALVYTCLYKHVAGTFATDLTAVLWVLSGNQQPWVTSTAYTIGDAVYVNGNNYICVVAHTSGTFATDLASADWIAAAPDETTLIFTCISISTLSIGKKILFLIAVLDE